MSLADKLPTRVFAAASEMRDVLGLLRPNKNRSYLHGLLFDSKGGSYRTEEMTFAVPKQAIPVSYRSRFYFDIYEKAERHLIRKHLSPDARVVELGGCIGVVSCVINRLLRDGARHVVVEPNPSLIPTLTANRDRNGCAFAIEQCLVGDGDSGVFSVGKLMSGNRVGMRRGRRITVPMRSFYDIERRAGFEADTIVMDIEGGELDFMRLYADALRRTNLVIIEVHDSILGADGARFVRDTLSAAGLARVETESLTEVWRRPRSA